MGMPNFFKIGEGVVKGVFDIGFGICFAESGFQEFVINRMARLSFFVVQLGARWNAKKIENLAILLMTISQKR